MMLSIEAVQGNVLVTAGGVDEGTAQQTGDKFLVKAKEETPSSDDVVSQRNKIKSQSCSTSRATQSAPILFTDEFFNKPLSKNIFLRERR